MNTLKNWLNLIGSSRISYSAGAILIIVFLSTCTKQSVENIDNTVRVNVKSPSLISLKERIRSTGILKSKEESKLSFKTGGLISTIYVDEGDYVKSGQKLAELNLSEITAKQNQAVLAFEKAERDFKRAKNLFTDSVVTLEQFQNAETALSYAKQNLQIAAFNLEHSVIKAPESGTILKKLASENEIIAAGYPVFLFATSGESWLVKTNLSDRDIVRVQEGDTANLNFDAFPNRIFVGEVSSVGEFSDPYTGTYQVEIKVKPNGVKFVNGLICKSEIQLSKTKTVYELPISALISANEKEGSVFRIENDIAIKTEVKIYSLTDSSILLSSGVKTSSHYVVSGGEYIKKDSKIKVLE